MLLQVDDFVIDTERHTKADLERLHAELETAMRIVGVLLEDMEKD